jgi:hypothetical protein
MGETSSDACVPLAADPRVHATDVHARVRAKRADFLYAFYSILHCSGCSVQQEIEIIAPFPA